MEMFSSMVQPDPLPVVASKSSSHISSYENDDDDTIEPTESSLDVLECDYDVDCTALYKALERKDWTAALKFLETGFWPGQFFSDAISPADQARTWVTRFEHEGKTTIMWSQLCLHLAILLQAPLAIVEKLLQAYPQAIRCTDDQHYLPLHLAFKHDASDAVLEVLLKTFPEALHAKGKQGKTPLECCGENVARASILEVLAQRTEHKVQRKMTQVHQREVKRLQDSLDDVQSQVLALETAKQAIELELKHQAEELRKARLVESLIASQKVNELNASLEQAKRAQQDARRLERGLSQELDHVHQSLATSMSQGGDVDWDALQQHVASLQEHRLQDARSETNMELQALKQALEKDLKQAQGKTVVVEELTELHKALDALDILAVTSHQELEQVKSDLSQVQKDYKATEEAAQTKRELLMLKKLLEQELATTDNKHSKKQLEAIQRAVASIDPEELDQRSLKELVELKKELETLKSEVQTQQLARTSQDELQHLIQRLRQDIIKSNDTELVSEESLEHKDALRDMLQRAKNLSAETLEDKSNQELLDFVQALDDLNQQYQETQEVPQLRQEIQTLQANMASQSVGLEEERKMVQELHSAMSSGQPSRGVRELKTELETLKELIKIKQDVAQIKEDLKTLQLNCKEQLKKRPSGANRAQLKSIQKTIKAVDVAQLENQQPEDLRVLRKELDEMKRNLALTEVRAVEATLMDQIEYCETKTGESLLVTRMHLQRLDRDNLEAKGLDELTDLRTALQNILETEVPVQKKQLKGLAKMMRRLSLRTSKRGGRENRNPSIASWDHGSLISPPSMMDSGMKFSKTRSKLEVNVCGEVEIEPMLSPISADEENTKQ